MNSLIQLLRSELVAIIKRIDNGDCDISDVDDMNEVITVLRKTTQQKGLDGSGGVFSYITALRRWLRTDCADSA